MSAIKWLVAVGAGVVVVMMVKLGFVLTALLSGSALVTEAPRPSVDAETENARVPLADATSGVPPQHRNVSRNFSTSAVQHPVSSPPAVELSEPTTPTATAVASANSAAVAEHSTVADIRLRLSQPADESIAIDSQAIVAKCDQKNRGSDQRSKLTISLLGQAGNTRTMVYRRLWKDTKGVENIADKMLLFAEEPSDARGLAFMHWNFGNVTDKYAERWVYLPDLRKTRRVAIRDLSENFLGSDVSLADVRERPIEQDEHRFLGTDERDGARYYVIESTPKTQPIVYSKRIFWFLNTGNRDSCVRGRGEYYDTKGELLKRQTIAWQKVKDAWLWKKMEMENVQTQHKTTFEIEDAEVNVGISDLAFTERAMKAGVSP